MAVEAGGFTGIIEADEVVVDYLVAQRRSQRRRGTRAGSTSATGNSFALGLGIKGFRNGC